MKKKGDADLVTTTGFSLAAGGFLLILFINLAVYLGGNEHFFTTFEAYDVKYTMDALYAMPHNIIVTYPDNTSRYIYDFDKSRITVAPKVVLPDKLRVTGYYTPTEGQDVEDKFNHPQSLCFSKISGDVLVSEIRPPDLDRINTPDIKVNIRTKLLLIDPGQQSADITIPMAKRLKFYKPSGFEMTMLTYEGPSDVAFPDDYRIGLSRNSIGILLGIYVGSDSDESKNPVKIHYRNNPQSRKLAEILANTFSERFGERITSTSMIPSRQEILNQENTEAAVIVEIGNVQISDNPLFSPSGQEEVVQAIRESLDTFVIS